MKYLRESTSQSIKIGPFVDNIDGYTAETGLTIANTDILLAKDGGAYASKNSGGATYDINGWYTATLDATDTNTVGHLDIDVNMSGALPVWASYTILETSVYDNIFASGATFNNLSSGQVSTLLNDGVNLKNDAITSDKIGDAAFVQSQFETDALLAQDFLVNGRVDVGRWLGTAVTTGTTSGKPQVDVYAISNDVTAANNLELMYDGNGYVADTAPASRSQVDGISGGSGGTLNFANEGDNTLSPIKSVSFLGAEDTGDNTSVNAEDGSYHIITDDGADNIDIVYQFDVGGGRTASGLLFTGYLTSSNDTANIQAYNGSGWDTIYVLAGQNGSTDVNESIPLLSTHTGTGSDLGKVFIRITVSSGSVPILNVDRLLVQAVSIGQTVGYADGSIWIDTNASNTNTEAFVDGTADNPVSTLAAALTLLSSTGLKRIHTISASALTLSSSFPYQLLGDNYSLDLNGQDIGGAIFEKFGPTSGTGINAAGSPPVFNGGPFVDVTLPPSILIDAGFLGTMTVGSAGDYLLLNCHSQIPGASAPTIDFNNVGGTTMSLRRWSGGLTLNNLSSGDVVSIDALSGGSITLNGADATVHVRGMVNIANNLSGTYSVVGTNNMDQRFDNLDVRTLPSGEYARQATITGDGVSLKNNAISITKIANETFSSSQFSDSVFTQSMFETDALSSQDFVTNLIGTGDVFTTLNSYGALRPTIAGRRVDVDSNGDVNVTSLSQNAVGQIFEHDNGSPTPSTIGFDFASMKSDLDLITGAAGVVLDSGAITSGVLAQSAVNYIQFGLSTYNQVDNIATGTAPSAAAIRAEIDSNSTQLASLILKTLPSGEYARQSTLELIPTGTGSAPTAAAIRTEIDANSTQLATLNTKADTAQGDLDTITGSDGVYLDSVTTDVYHADIEVHIDTDNTQDEYTVTWFKNGQRLSSGITSPTIQVVKRVDGTDLIASTAMTQIGSTGAYKYDASTRLTNGEAALVIVAATISGGSRSFAKVVGRDS